eukprot:5251497-Heterocapsa_arctica.AAC.1
MSSRPPGAPSHSHRQDSAAGSWASCAHRYRSPARIGLEQVSFFTGPTSVVPKTWASWRRTSSRA